MEDLVQDPDEEDYNMNLDECEASPLFFRLLMSKHRVPLRMIQSWKVLTKSASSCWSSWKPAVTDALTFRWQVSLTIFWFSVIMTSMELGKSNERKSNERPTSDVLSFLSFSTPTSQWIKLERLFWIFLMHWPHFIHPQKILSTPYLGWFFWRTDPLDRLLAGWHTDKVQALTPPILSTQYGPL